MSIVANALLRGRSALFVLVFGHAFLVPFPACNHNIVIFGFVGSFGFRGLRVSLEEVICDKFEPTLLTFDPL